MRLWLVLMLLSIALLILAAASMLLGPGNVGLAQIAQGLTPPERTILLLLRAPRVLMAILAGSALAVSGALMQTFFRNPLAEPYVTGVSAGGALGAVAGRALGLAGALGTGATALLGASAITAVLYAFAMRRARYSAASVLLLGLALGTLCGAIVWFILLRLGPGGTDQAIAWLLGRLSTVGYDEVLALAPAVAVGIAVAWAYVGDLDALLLGEEKAASLGVDVPAAQRGILGAATLLAASCVAYCGVIAFAGLMVPHVMRGITGARHARLLPLAALGGAVFLLAIDLASRILDPPREIPLTILTSLLGAPFFIGVLLRSRSVAV
jgi:iron complex transport system permease protein